MTRYKQPENKKKPGPAQKPKSAPEKSGIKQAMQEGNSKVSKEVKKQAAQLDSGKPGQKKLPGMPDDVEGKLLTTTAMEVAVRKLITGVELRMGDDGKYRFIKGEVIGKGDTIEEAQKDFKSKWKQHQRNPK